MKKFLLIIQGEGRGHLTQAIALSEMLERAGHVVVASMVGVSANNKIPNFFSDRISSPIIPFRSPALVYHPITKSLSIKRTIINSLRHFQSYTKSILHIQEAVNQYQPDVIINFYDVLGGIHQLVSKLPIYTTKPSICIAHQYLLLHPDFIYPNSYKRIDKILVNLNSFLTSLCAKKKIALSFREITDCTNKSIFVVPPLLRSEVWKLKSNSDDFILAYMTQPSMLNELFNWHHENSEVMIHCFIGGDLPKNTISRNLNFHKIDGEKFLKMMSNCKGLVTTAGFESVCEAMAFEKPVMMIPLKNHFEQACNAVDAEISGAGIIVTTFNLSPFLKYLSELEGEKSDTQHWFEKAEEKILYEICENHSYKIEKIYERYEFEERVLQPI